MIMLLAIQNTLHVLVRWVSLENPIKHLELKLHMFQQIAKTWQNT